MPTDVYTALEMLGLTPKAVSIGYRESFAFIGTKGGTYGSALWQKNGQGNRSAEIISAFYHDELSDCQVCQSGKYNEKGGSICRVCSIGKYRSHPNDGKSVSTLVNGQNAESCSSCAVGTLSMQPIYNLLFKGESKTDFTSHSKQFRGSLSYDRCALLCSADVFCNGFQIDNCVEEEVCEGKCFVFVSYDASNLTLDAVRDPYVDIDHGLYGFKGLTSMFEYRSVPKTHCGHPGSTPRAKNVANLEDGTPYGWDSPGSYGSDDGLDRCKVKCAKSPSCSSFVWQRDGSNLCWWKTGVTENTMYSDNNVDCYFGGQHKVRLVPDNVYYGFAMTAHVDAFMLDQPYTILLELKTSSTRVNMVIIGKSRGPKNGWENQFKGWSLNNGVLQAWVGLNPSTATNSDLRDGKYHVLALIYRGNNDIQSYIDGTFYPMSTDLNHGADPSGSKLYVGKLHNIEGYEFIGEINKVQYFNYELNSAEILEIQGNMYRDGEYSRNTHVYVKQPSRYRHLHCNDCQVGRFMPNNGHVLQNQVRASYVHSVASMKRNGWNFTGSMMRQSAANTDCGGNPIDPLDNVEATMYGYQPPGNDIEICKALCATSSSCTAFQVVGNQCYWRKDNNFESANAVSGSVCYSFNTIYNANVMSSSCRYSTWYGFGSPSGEAGVITKVMHGYGKAILDFGNCGSSGEVKVYLDNELVATAGAYTRSKIVNFDFADSQVLRLQHTPNSNAIISFNTFHGTVFTRSYTSYASFDFLSRRNMEIEGWKFSQNMDSGTLTANPQCGKASWFGMATGSNVGSIQLVLQGKSGNLLLDYDNCGHAGTVGVYLDDMLISSAPSGTNKIAIVPYTHGQILKIQDESGDAIIQVNKLYNTISSYRGMLSVHSEGYCTNESDAFSLSYLNSNYPNIPQIYTNNQNGTWEIVPNIGLGICNVKSVESCLQICNIVDGCNFFSTSKCFLQLT